MDGHLAAEAKGARPLAVTTKRIGVVEIGTHGVDGVGADRRRRQDDLRPGTRQLFAIYRPLDGEARSARRA